MAVDSITDELRASIVEQLQRDLDAARDDLVSALVSEAPQGETGELRQSISVDPWDFDGGTFRTFARATAPQARYTDEGTGIYGPVGGRIYPRNARALVFEWHGVTVAFASVAGQPAQRWFNEPMPRYFDFALERVLR